MTYLYGYSLFMMISLGGLRYAAFCRSSGGYTLARMKN